MTGLKLTGLLAAAALLVAVSTFTVQSTDAPPVSFDGLHLHTGAKVAIAYVKPEADFSVYNEFMMLDTYVAFKKNWQRDTKVAGRRVSNKDIERIKTEAAELLRDTFKNELDEKGGYKFVTTAADNVLLLRPALIDLEITAPDINTPGRVTQYVASAGAATLYLEMYDSVSGEILARVVDRRRMQDYGTARWATSVSNRAEAQRMFRRWAELLRAGMDEVRANAGLAPMLPVEPAS